MKKTRKPARRGGAKPKKRPARRGALPPETPDAAGTAVPRAANLATTAQMAKLFACTERQIQLLAEQGIVKRVGHGRYDFAESTINYVTHLRAQAAGRAGVDSESDTAAANAERSREQTALYRLRRIKEERQVIHIDEVREIGKRITRGVRQFVLGLANSIAHEVPTLTPRDIAAVRKLCADGLEDAAAGKGFALAGLQTEFNDDVSGGPPGNGDIGGAEAAAAGDAVEVG